MSPPLQAFVVMPFGLKKLPDGTEIDCDDIYKRLLEPAIVAAGLAPHRADADRRGGSIHLDMLQDLLLAEFVVADVTMDNPNVWYEIGIRHALRAGGTVITYAVRDRLPFDIAGQRLQHYTLNDGKLDPTSLEGDRKALTDAIAATLGSWRGRRASPVYQMLPYLQEPDWKTLKVGEINEYWQAQERRQQRVEVARRNQRPGDILVLADETPNSILEFEALRSAGDALLKMKRPHYALSILEKARRLNPDDVQAQKLQFSALGLLGRFAEAREGRRVLAARFNDGESQGIIARIWYDEWLQLWNSHPARQSDPFVAARDTAATLQSAAAAYYDAFRASPADHYLGINALLLGGLWEHVTGRKSKWPSDAIPAVINWSIEVAITESSNRFWALLSRAEMVLLANHKEAALDDYAEAAALAVANRDRYALDSSSRQLDFLGTLEFRPDIVAQAAQMIDRGENQLDALIGLRPAQVEPKHVVVFNGHMIDNPANRGPGKAKPARFPPEKIDAVAREIRARLDKVGAGAGDLGLCSGASGGDLLFAEACLERGMRLELHLARKEAEFLAELVTFADPDHRWERSFAKVKENPATTVYVMPDELGEPPKGVRVHEHCNRWMLYSALSQGLARLSFVALWNGKPGDGPGATEHMVDLVRQLTGKAPDVIDLGQM